MTRSREHYVCRVTSPLCSFILQSLPALLSQAQELQREEAWMDALDRAGHEVACRQSAGVLTAIVPSLPLPTRSLTASHCLARHCTKLTDWKPSE